MIKNIPYEQKYFEQVLSLCKENELAFPDDNFLLFIAVNEDDQVLGLCGLKKEIRVEPWISINPVIGVRLASMVEGAALALGEKILVANVNENNKKQINQLEKVGYVVEDKKVILRKRY